MKKLLISILATVALCATTVFADASSDAEKRREKLVKRIESCEAILREFMAKPETAIPSTVLSQAKAIIITNQFKAGFLLGFREGYGVILVKRADGQWSVPAMLNAGETSLGVQAGGSTVETVYIVTDAETPRRLFNARFNIGVDAKAVAGPHIAEKVSENHPILKTPLLVYMKGSGLFAGTSIKAGRLTCSTSANQEFYKTRYTLPELVYSDWVPAPDEVKPLMSYVQSLAP